MKWADCLEQLPSMIGKLIVVKKLNRGFLTVLINLTGGKNFLILGLELLGTLNW